MKSDAHDVRAVFDDTLLNAITKFKADSGHDFIRYFKSSWRRRRANLYNKTKKVRENEVYEREIEGYESDFEDNNFASISDSITVEDKVFKTKEADQWKLIDYLVRGENERTTAIVQTFLTHPKPTATAIAKELGLDHKQVSRALTRPQAKYSTKQFGDYTDYLIAL